MQTEKEYLYSRAAHPDDTVVEIGGVRIGGGHFALIAGPCAVESRSQLLETARAVKQSGAALLRGGAFKPRSSPYDFQGLGEEGLALLREAGRRTGLPVVSEILSAEQLPLFEGIDMLQIGARNMQNYPLLRAVGRSGKPVLLKRGFGCTLRELLLSAEYLLAEGNPNVVLCERGIRSFEPSERGTLDLAAVPLLHAQTHLPVLIDPSHAAGQAALVEPLSLAGCAAGCDGLIVEVHCDPSAARSDAAQALTPARFDHLARRVRAIRQALTD